MKESGEMSATILRLVPGEGVATARVSRRSRFGLHSVAVLVAEFRRRLRSRARLARLDDYMLRDIGITRAEAGREANKPFWRA
jgi:uncharacterized protein YjiS (DUF1127 family)